MRGNGNMTTLREAMNERRVSYRDLAFLTELDAGFLCRVANGQRRLSRESALRVARALRISPRRLRDLVR